jgi:hypothetical protein
LTVQPANQLVASLSRSVDLDGTDTHAICPEHTGNPWYDYFRALVHYKDFPNCPFEPRIEPIILLLLPEILSILLHDQVALVSPPFPVKKQHNYQNNCSGALLFKVRAGGGLGSWILAELKTDTRSIRKDQMEFYMHTLGRPMRDLVQRIRSAPHSSSLMRVKYEHPLSHIEAFPLDYPIELVYLSPGPIDLPEMPGPVRSFSFKEIASLPLTRYGEIWDALRDIVLPRLTS